MMIRLLEHVPYWGQAGDTGLSLRGLSSGHSVANKEFKKTEVGYAYVKDERL